MTRDGESAVAPRACVCIGFGGPRFLWQTFESPNFLGSSRWAGRARVLIVSGTPPGSRSRRKVWRHQKNFGSSHRERKGGREGRGEGACSRPSDLSFVRQCARSESRSACFCQSCRSGFRSAASSEAEGQTHEYRLGRRACASEKEGRRSRSRVSLHLVLLLPMCVQKVSRTRACRRRSRRHL